MRESLKKKLKHSRVETCTVIPTEREEEKDRERERARARERELNKITEA